MKGIEKLKEFFKGHEEYYRFLLEGIKIVSDIPILDEFHLRQKHGVH